MVYDPNATGITNQGLFGFPYTEAQSKVVIIPVPWDVTTSFGKGTSRGPEAVLESSFQLDVCDAIFGDVYEHGIFMQEISQEWQMLNQQYSPQALQIQKKLEQGVTLDEQDIEQIATIDNAGEALNNWVEGQTLELLAKGKIPAVLGGDHSSPFGLVSGLRQKFADLTILHIDAHMDLRKDYQGFKHSHASIMRNICDQLEPQALVQVGIRDFCPEERDYSRMHNFITTHYDAQTSLRVARGNSWYSVCQEIIEPLSQHVYVSFDIDGLSPDLCPNTGTPVPGGLSFNDVSTLLYSLIHSNRKVVGFDLCEVSPGQDLNGWDGNVGARILYKLCGAALSS